MLAAVFGAAEEELCRRIGTPGQAGAPSHTGSPAPGSRQLQRPSRQLLPALIRQRITGVARLRCPNPSPLRWQGRWPAGNPTVRVVDLDLLAGVGAQWDVTEL